VAGVIIGILVILQVVFVVLACKRNEPPVSVTLLLLANVSHAIAQSLLLVIIASLTGVLYLATAIAIAYLMLIMFQEC
jgi:hypothetical protein